MNKMDEKDLNTGKNSYLSFVISGELFAIDVHHVVKIIEVTKFTKVPQVPDHFKGVTNFSGGVLPVVDPYVKFGFPTKKATPKEIVLVLDVHWGDRDIQTGMLIEEAQEVFEVGAEQIIEYPAAGNKFKADYIDGVVERNGQFILLLNCNQLFFRDDLESIIDANESK